MSRKSNNFLSETPSAVVDNMFFQAIRSWDVEIGPSRYELMIAQWHDPSFDRGPERLELTLESNLDCRRKRKAHIVVISSAKFLGAVDKDNWKIGGLLYPANDPLGILDDNAEVEFSMVYNVRTRKGTLRVI